MRVWRVSLVMLLPVLAVAQRKHEPWMDFRDKNTEALNARITAGKVNEPLKGPYAETYTPLIAAVAWDWTDGVRLLLKAGADIEARASEGKTALMAGASSGRPETVSILLDAGAKVNARSARGATALHYCVSWTQYDFFITGFEERLAIVAQMLLDKGADIEARDGLGRTALMWAAGWRHLPTLKTLIAAGADLEAADAAGRTALTWCGDWGKDGDNVKELLAAGAKM